jgi:hypothetical protein
MMVDDEVPAPLFVMVGSIAPRGIKKKKKKRRGSQGSPVIGEAPLPTYAQTQRKKKKKKKNGCMLYLGVANGAFVTSNACAQALNSIGSLLLKFMFQAVQTFHFLNIPSSKFSNLTLNPNVEDVVME